MVKYIWKLVKLFRLGIILAFTGCIPLTTLQTPEVLAPGKTSGGVGFNGFLDTGENEFGVYEIDIFFRRGLAKRLDGGIKIFGFPGLFGGVQGDVKYQLVDDPFFVAISLGAFYSSADSFGDDNINTYCLLYTSPSPRDPE